MRQTISGLIAAIAVVMAGAAPATACGVGPFEGVCAQAYVPIYGYAGCNGGCSAFERLPDLEQQYHHAYRRPQYYYVNQGPTYTGPGSFAPYPTYQESTVVSGRDIYRRPHYRGPVLRRYY
jgi:hypothetical protein